MVRKRYLDELKAYNITTPQGKVHGHLALKAKGKAVSLSGDMSFEDVSIKMSGFPLHNLKGRFVAAGNNFQVEHFTGNLGKSTFTAAGVIDQQFHRCRGEIVEHQHLSSCGHEEFLEFDRSKGRSSAQDYNFRTNSSRCATDRHEQPINRYL